MLTFKQLLLGLFGAFKMEFVNGGGHEFGYLVVAKVAYASGMSVMYVLVRNKIPGFNLKANLLVCVAERCAGQYTAVYLFNLKHCVVARVINNMFVYFRAGYDVFRHLQAIDQFFECRHEYFLYQLEVA